MNRSIRKMTAVILALIIVLSSVAFVFAESNAAPNPEGSQPTAVSAENGAANEGEGANEDQMRQRADLYTVMALIALGAIVVGIREKRRGR